MKSGPKFQKQAQELAEAALNLDGETMNKVLAAMSKDTPERKLDLTELRRELQLGQNEMASLLDEVRNRLEKQLSDRAGHIVAAPNNSKLRFWLGSLPKKNT